LGSFQSALNSPWGRVGIFDSIFKGEKKRADLAEQKAKRGMAVEWAGIFPIETLKRKSMGKGPGSLK